MKSNSTRHIGIVGDMKDEHQRVLQEFFDHRKREKAIVYGFPEVNKSVGYLQSMNFWSAWVRTDDGRNFKVYKAFLHKDSRTGHLCYDKNAFTLEFDERGYFRVFHKHTNAYSQWAHHGGIASIEVYGTKYFTATDYWRNVLPTETVFVLENAQVFDAEDEDTDDSEEEEDDDQ